MNTSSCTLDLSDLQRKLNTNTKVVALGGASNAVGSINDLDHAVRMVRHICPLAIVYVDAVHYAPHVLIDVKELDCDFLVCSAYKFFGPHVGVLFGKRELLSRFKPYKVSAIPDDAYLPMKWETGTQNHEGLAGVIAAIDYLTEYGKLFLNSNDCTQRSLIVTAMKNIMSYESTLSEYFLEQLKCIPRIKIFGVIDSKKRTPTFSFIVDGMHSDEVQKKLADKGIFVWSGNFYAIHLAKLLFPEDPSRAMVRIGMLHYNLMEEIDALIVALKDILCSQL